MINYLGHELCIFQLMSKNIQRERYICNKCNIIYRKERNNFYISILSTIKSDYDKDLTCAEALIKQIIE